jgi:NaMN:DMB phosphoribosyltransferase
VGIGVTGHVVGGQAPAESDPAAPVTRPEAETEASEATVTTDPGSAPVTSLPGTEPAPPALFQITVRAPGGHIVAQEIAEEDELAERLTALLFVADGSVGYTVASEPIKT